MASALQKLSETKAPSLKALAQTKNVPIRKKPNILSSIFNAPGRFAESALNKLTMNKLPGLLPKPEPAQNIVEKAAEVTGNIVGETLPFVASYGTIGKAAELGLTKALPKVAKLAKAGTEANKLRKLAAEAGVAKAALPKAATLAQKASNVALTATKGAAASGAVGGIGAAVEGKKPVEVAKQAGLYGALGAVGDPLLEGVAAPLAKRAGTVIFNKLPDSTKNALLKRFTETKVAEPVAKRVAPSQPLALPSGQDFTFRNLTPEEVTSRVLPERPLALPEGSRDFTLVDEPLRFKTQVKGVVEKGRAKFPIDPEDKPLIDYFRQKNIPLDTAAKRVEGEYSNMIARQVEYLKTSGGKGVEQGGLARDAVTDEVVGRFGRVSNNPKWYQDFYNEFGRAPRQGELQGIAIKQLREGFGDLTMNVPPDEKFVQVEALLDTLKDLQGKYPKNIITSRKPTKPQGLLETGQTFILKDSPLQFKTQAPQPFEKPGITPVRPPYEEKPLQFKTTVQVPRVPADAELAVQSGNPLYPLSGKATGEAAVPTEPAIAKLAATKAPTEKLRKFPQTIAKGELTAPELKKMIKENPQTYQPITNKETLATAQKIINDNFDAAKALVMEGKSFDNATETAIAQDMVRRLQADKRWDDAFDVMAKASEKLTRAGQTIQAASMWRRMTPEGMLKYAVRVVEDANKQLPVNRKIKLSPELQERVYNAMKQIEQMEDGIDKDQAIMKVLDDIESEIPVTLARKLSTIQAMSHLLNVKTTLRNIIGNASFATAETVSNVLAIPFDKMISEYTGKRLVAIPGFKEPLGAGLAQAKRAAKEVSMGISVEPGKYELFRGRTFRKGALARLEKGLGYSLRVPDEFFKGYRETQALQQMTKMAGVKEATPEMVAQAAHEARYAAFQDESLPAQILQAVKDAANKIGIGKTIPGAQMRATKEFGLGDFIIKYTRVPGNLISRAVEYTPLGLVKALTLMAQAKKTGAMNQRELALTLGRVMTGSSVISMGAWLHNQGLLLSEDKDRDKDAKALERSEGLGNYKVNLSALGRLLSGESATSQSGDELYSYNWIEPVSVGFAIGATIDAQLKKDGTPAQMSMAIGTNSVDEMLDLPTLYIIKSMVYEGMGGDGNGFTVATVPVAEGVPGFIPSVVRQLAQMTDPTAREIRGKTPMETAVLKTKSNIPKVREGLLPRVSPLGKEITYPTGLIPSMVNPATKSVYKPSQFTGQLKQLEDLTGEVGHYPPRSAPKSFIFQAKKYELTPEEQVEYQKVAGELIDKRFTAMLKEKDMKKLSGGQRQALVKQLEKVISDAREYAKMKTIQTRRTK